MSRREPERTQPEPPTYLPNVPVPPPPPGPERTSGYSASPQQSKCIYCGSRCTDSRGNCGACGAPLEDEQTGIDYGELMKHSNYQWMDYEKPKSIKSAFQSTRELAKAIDNLAKTIGY